MQVEKWRRHGFDSAEPGREAYPAASAATKSKTCLVCVSLMCHCVCAVWRLRCPPVTSPVTPQAVLCALPLPSGCECDSVDVTCVLVCGVCRVTCVSCSSVCVSAITIVSVCDPLSCIRSCRKKYAMVSQGGMNTKCAAALATPRGAQAARVANLAPRHPAAGGRACARADP